MLSVQTSLFQRSGANHVPKRSDLFGEWGLMSAYGRGTLVAPSDRPMELFRQGGLQVFVACQGQFRTIGRDAIYFHSTSGEYDKGA